MKYRKTVLIDAEQFDGSERMIKRYNIYKDQLKHGSYFIETKEGSLSYYEGDWIATGVDGEHWAIVDDIFKRTYEPVDNLSLPANIEELKRRITADMLEAQREGNEAQKGGLLIALWEIDHLAESSARDDVEADK